MSELSLKTGFAGALGKWNAVHSNFVIGGKREDDLRIYRATRRCAAMTSYRNGWSMPKPSACHHVPPCASNACKHHYAETVVP